MELCYCSADNRSTSSLPRLVKAVGDRCLSPSFWATLGKNWRGLLFDDVVVFTTNVMTEVLADAAAASQDPIVMAGRNATLGSFLLVSPACGALLARRSVMPKLGGPSGLLLAALEARCQLKSNARIADWSEWLQSVHRNSEMQPSLWALSNVPASRLSDVLWWSQRFRFADGAVPPSHRRGNASSSRVGFIVLTKQEFHDTRLAPLLKSWGRGARIILAASDSADERYPLTQDLNVRSKDDLGRKALMAWQRACDRADLDWIVMVDDDTFVITANLEAKLRKYDPSLPWYLGCKLTHLGMVARAPFVAGGAGIVLSRAALRRFCSAAMQSSACHPFRADSVMGAGDTAIGDCMDQLGIKPTNVEGFYPFPSFGMQDPNDNWCKRSWWTPKHVHCPPRPTAVTFHYVPPEMFSEMDWWITSFHRYPPPSRAPRRR